MLQSALLLGLWFGCAPKSSPGVDLSLPERIEAVPRQSALEILEVGAGSEEPGIRAQALLVLVLGAADPVPWGERALWDPDPWVQRVAGCEFAKRGEAEGVVLEYLARAADPVSRGAVGLCAPSTEAVRAVLFAQWKTEAPLWKRVPLALAAAAHGDPEAEALVEAALAVADIPQQALFLGDVARSGLVDLGQALAEGQARSEPELTLAFAHARMQLGDASGENAFRGALQHDSEEVRLEALDYLVTLDHPGVEPLLRRAHDDGPDFVSTYASLAMAARDGAPAELRSGVAHPDWEIRALCMHLAIGAYQGGLMRRRDQRLVEELVVSGLADGHPAVLRAACEAASTLMLTSLTKEMDPGLVHPDESVRMACAGARLLLSG